MTLYELELHVTQIVKDLRRAQNRRHTDPRAAWTDVDHALDVCLEIARVMEEGWENSGMDPS